MAEERSIVGHGRGRIAQAPGEVNRGAVRAAPATVCRIVPLVALLVVTGTAVAADASREDGEAPFSRVLFVGNSLTASWDVPGIVAAISRAAGDAPPLEVTTVARGGFGLEDHWRDREALARIREGRWRWVVLQQGPSALPASRRSLVGWARRFDAEIRAVGARPALYAVWPSEAREVDFPRVGESYRIAAERVDGLLLPAGEAWRAAWRIDPSLELRGEDGFHPTPLGSFLAAATIWAVLTAGDPARIPAEVDLEWGRFRLPEEVVATVRGAVTEALAPSR